VSTERLQAHLDPVELIAWSLLAIGILLLIGNCVALAYLTGTFDPDALAQAMVTADNVLDFYLRSTEARSDSDRVQLLSVLDEARVALSSAGSVSAVAEIIWRAGQRFDEVSHALNSANATKAIVNVVEAATRRERFDGRSLVSIASAGSELPPEVTVQDTAGLLSVDDRAAILRIVSQYGLTEVVDIRVNGREAYVIASATTREQISLLEDDNSRIALSILSLRRSSGVEELSGPGVVIRAYDAEDGYAYHEIVHDQDVRNLVDLMWASGAAGVEVGGQRMTVQSSVRCAGPIILVNQHPIAVNPVVIEACGDPEALEQAVLGVAETFAVWGKRIEVHRQDLVSLSAGRLR
jgi:hypothetical protein